MQIFGILVKMKYKKIHLENNTLIKSTISFNEKQKCDTAFHDYERYAYKDKDDLYAKTLRKNGILYLSDKHLYLKFLGLNTREWPIFCDRAGTLCWFNYQDTSTNNAIRQVRELITTRHTYIIKCQNLDFRLAETISFICDAAEIRDLGRNFD